MHTIRRWLIILMASVATPACNTVMPHPDTPRLHYRVLHTYPHAKDAFTQGLVYHQGRLYESTGLNGHSSIRRVRLEDGAVENAYLLDGDYFGEGLTRINDKLYQLTWRSNKGFVYSLDDLRLLRQFRYPQRGWGLAYDGKHLIMSDGSDRLYFLDPVHLKVEKTLRVRDHDRRIFYLNELEFVDGKIYANIYLNDTIAVIDPQSGQITAWILLHDLYPKVARGSAHNMLNGIAYDPEHKRWFITGKRWPHLYAVEWVAPSAYSQ